MGVVKVCWAVVMCMVVFAAPMAEAAISCDQVEGSLRPCLGFLRNGGVVPPTCCNGVRGLNEAAKTPADRRATCRCLKSSAAKFKGIKLPNAASLPSKCGLNLRYRISRNTNCDNVK